MTYEIKIIKIYGYNPESIWPYNTYNTIQLWTFQLLYMMWYAPKKSLLTKAIAEVNNDFLVHINIMYNSWKVHNCFQYYITKYLMIIRTSFGRFRGHSELDSEKTGAYQKLRKFPWSFGNRLGKNWCISAKIGQYRKIFFLKSYF